MGRRLTPPRRSRLPLALSPAVLAAVVLVACGLPPGELQQEAVERDVAAEYERRDGVGLDLDCPADMMVASGEVHHCAGTTDEGERLTVEIQISDDLDGSYTWMDFRGPIRTATPGPRPGG